MRSSPVAGFSATHFFRDHSNWFIPNSACLHGWLEASGFSVVKLTQRSSPIPREWNVHKIPRSTTLFHATRTSTPTPEYATDEYHVYRVESEDPQGMHQFILPTWFECEQARRLQGKRP